MNDCTEPYGRGVEKTFYIIDREDIDWGKSVRTGNSVKIVLAQGKRGYKLLHPSREVPAITKEDNNPAIGTSWTKTLPVAFLAPSPENADAIMALKQGRFVAIYENTVKGENGKQAFHVIGYEVGAVGQDMSSDTSAEESQGGWTGNIVEANAPSPDIFYFDTDYETTKAALESMCSAPAPSVL